MLQHFLLTLLWFLNFYPYESSDSFIKKELEIKKEWIRENPSLKSTKSSFFNCENTRHLFFFAIDISPENTLFICDCENKLINQYRNKESIKFSLIKGKKANPIHQGTKLIPERFPEIVILVNYDIVDSKIISWYKAGVNECPGTYVFPYLKIDTTEFKKKYGNRIANPIFNMVSSKIKGEEIEGENIKMVMGVYSPTLRILKKSIKPALPYKNTLQTVNGKEIHGTSLDLNNDKKPDVFWFIESLNDGSEYLRIYLNIEGNWCCKWVELIEECV